VRIIDSKSGLEGISGGQVLSIGNFDGLHLGHQRIIETARSEASRRGTGFAVMTFSPHPVAILSPENRPGLLTPLVLKTSLLERQGVETLIVVKDSAELLGLSPEGFVDEFLMKSIRPCVLVEGENFHFGAGRAGNVHTLESLGAERGFGVLIVPTEQAVLGEDTSLAISSTLIRNLLREGSVSKAACALGRAYRLVGRVVSGRGRGAELGFPTANIEPVNQIIPADAVYAGYAGIAGSAEEVCGMRAELPCAISIGSSTPGIGENLVEVHILRTETGDLYGKWLAVDFVERLRLRRQFESETELSEQIAEDCKDIRLLLEQRRNQAIANGSE